MSTNADLILETEQGYFSIYLHSDGYPNHTFKILNKHYTDREKVENMIKLGNMSSLDESIDCPEGHSFENRIEGYSVFYNRDRGEAEQDAMFSRNLDDHKECAYSYLFSLDKNEWEIV